MRRVVMAVSVLGLILPAACNDGTGTVSTTPADTTTTAPPASPAVTTTAPSATTATTEPVTSRCRTVGFTPQSEDAASDVTATGLPCDEAEAFVRVAGERTSSGGPGRLHVAGYDCVRTRSEQDPLPQAFYECTNGPKTVTFVRS